MKGRKTGGRQKGTPNKPTPLKDALRAQSESYFIARPQVDIDGNPRVLEFRDKEGIIYNSITLADADGNPIIASNFEIDMMMMDAKDRATIQEKILRYHTPQMQAVSADVNLTGQIATTIEDRLAKLAAGEDPDIGADE